MLDDLKYIHEKDAQDALGVAEKQYQQLEYNFTIADDVVGRADNGDLFGGVKIRNIVVAGMGGSALAAELSKSWPGYDVPFEICRNYDIPRYVSSNTLFIASSYSGNTEETLAALTQAEEQGANIAVIAAGGKLKEIAESKKYPFLQLPSDFQPRYAVLYNFKALLTILTEAKLMEGITVEKLNNDLAKQAADWLKNAAAKLRPDVPSNDNLAKRLAKELMGNSVVVYSGPKFYPAAYKWKINFNENAKNVAWCNQLPEFNHNEFLGWTSHPTNKPYKVIDIRSNLEHERVQKRFEVTEKLLSGQRPAPEVITPEGETLLLQLLWVIQLGDFVSLYLSLLNGLNPTPVDLIERLKKELA